MTTPQTLGIIIGGLVPAFFFGLSAVFAKLSEQHQVSLSLYLMLQGLAIAVVGLLFFVFLPDRILTAKSALYSFSAGFVWSFGAAGVLIALQKYETPIGKLVPLYNMNTLVAVLLALWIFAEWKQVKVPQLLIGSVLIVVGGTLVAKA